MNNLRIRKGYLALIIIIVSCSGCVGQVDPEDYMLISKSDLITNPGQYFEKSVRVVTNVTFLGAARYRREGLFADYKFWRTFEMCEGNVCLLILDEDFDRDRPGYFILDNMRDKTLILYGEVSYMQINRVDQYYLKLKGAEVIV